MTGFDDREREVGFHPEDTCDLCQGPNVIWNADNDSWNVATAEMPNDRGCILCINCFTALYIEMTGERPVFEVRLALPKKRCGYCGKFWSGNTHVCQSNILF